MTIFVPDISHHQGAINMQRLVADGAVALIARVGQGAGRRRNGQTYGTTRDRQWQRNRDEAKRLGLLLVAYWYIGNSISAEENARLAAQWVGDTGLPWMLDCEDASGDIAFYRQVLTAFQRRGLRVVLSYIPNWYWAGIGRPSLAGLPPLVSSRYVTASGPPGRIYPGDAGNGWQSYGGNRVVLWQFTSKASMAGQLIDCSAFRGTREQLVALIGGIPEEDDMSAEAERRIQIIYTQLAGDPTGGGNTPIDQYPGWPQRGDLASFNGPMTLVDYQRANLALLRKVSNALDELNARPVADIDEAALAAELASRGIGGVTAAQVAEAVRAAFARAGGQPQAEAPPDAQP